MGLSKWNNFCTRLRQSLRNPIGRIRQRPPRSGHGRCHREAGTFQATAFVVWTHRTTIRTDIKVLIQPAFPVFSESFPCEISPMELTLCRQPASSCYRGHAAAPQCLPGAQQRLRRAATGESAARSHLRERHAFDVGERPVPALQPLHAGHHLSPPARPAIHHPVRSCPASRDKPPPRPNNLALLSAAPSPDWNRIWT